MAGGLRLRVLGALARIHRAHVDHPDISFLVLGDLVREDEEARAEALDDVAVRVELMHRRPARAGAAVVLEGRLAWRHVGIRAAAVDDPERAAVVVDGDAVQRAPPAALGQLAPRRDAAVGIGQIVGRRGVQVGSRV